MVTRESGHRGLWLFTGCLLVVEMAPVGLNVSLLFVTLFVLIGAINPVLSQGWSNSLLAGGLLLALVGGGTELYSQVTGYRSVMVVVGSAVVLSGTVAAMTVAVPSQWSLRVRFLEWLHSESDLRPALVSGMATERRWYPVWVVLSVWSVGVCVLHFSGLAYGYYTTFWWWDIMTHTLSGAGIGAWLYLLRPAAFSTQRRLFVFLVAVVVLLGAGFEIYEYLFQGFYEPWSVKYYLRDTVQDMLCNLTGAVLFSLFCFLSSSLSGVGSRSL